MEVKQKLIVRTDNRPMRDFASGRARFITVHMTGNRGVGADAAAHANWVYNSAPYSWHATVDDREAWQHLRWEEQGWHAGDGAGAGNTASIGIEICMHSGINQEKAYENAANLIAWLLAVGHGAEGIVQHNHWTGKNCPELIRAEPGRWERFLEQVYSGGDPMTADEKAAFAALVKKVDEMSKKLDAVAEQAYGTNALLHQWRVSAASQGVNLP